MRAFRLYGRCHRSLAQIIGAGSATSRRATPHWRPLAARMTAASPALARARGSGGTDDAAAVRDAGGATAAGAGAAKRGAAAQHEAMDAAATPTADAPKGRGKAAAKPRGGRGGAASAAAAAPAISFSHQEAAAARAQLVEWYDKVHRVLPWRRNPHSKLPQGSGAAAGGGGGSGGAVTAAPDDLSPQDFAYRVWVSEIMLQQTQVATVIPYFQRWVSRWPTVADLAAASQEDVNQQWAGLGYYRRARYLLEGAKHVTSKLGGSFPTTATGLRDIPGVGPYTAAAVASIAFGDRAAAVDGNVIRVISRLRALGGDPSKNTKAIEALAGQLLHPERPGCHNQAMMELGATVCKPANPACGACPVSGVCAAARRVREHAEGGGDPEAEGAPRVTDYPEKVAKAAKREQHVAVCVVKAWVPQQGPGASSGSGAAAAGGEAAAPAAKKQKRGGQQQGSILSFLASPKGGGGGGAVGGGSSASGSAAVAAAAVVESEEALAKAGREAHYLLVQRPPSGLLAGLWECPAAVISDGAEEAPSAAGASAAAAAERRALADALLAQLGVALPGGSAGSGEVRLVARRALGSVVHVFSHIRQTSHVEQVVVAAPSLAAACSAAGMGPAVAAAVAAVGEGGNGSKKGAAAKGRKRKGDGGSKEESGSEDEGAGGEAGAAAGGGGGARGAPALRWVSQRELRAGGEGLTTGVRKVLALAHALADGGKGAGGKKGGGGGAKRKGAQDGSDSE